MPLQLQYRFPSAVNASKEVRQLLDRVFVNSRDQRLSLAEMAAHPWVTDGGALPPIATVASLQGGSPAQA